MRPPGAVSWVLTSKLSTKLTVDVKSKPVDNVYSYTLSPVKPVTNILVPSLLKATSEGLLSWFTTSNLPTKVAVETSKAVVKLYSPTSLPALPDTNILVPSLLKVRPVGLFSWVTTLKLSTKVAAACAELTKVKLKIRNIENIFFK